MALAFLLLAMLGGIQAELMSVFGESGSFVVKARDATLQAQEFAAGEAAYGEFRNEMFVNGW